MAKRKTARSAANDETAPASFEDSLAELQQIVVELEDGRLGLEDSIGRFERAMGLLRSCYRLLENAEQKIELLTGFDADGRPETAAFDATATVEQPRKRSSPTDANDESGLF